METKHPSNATPPPLAVDRDGNPTQAPPPIAKSLGAGIVVGLLTSPDRARALGWKPETEDGDTP